MTDTHVSSLEKSLHKTNIWLKQIEEKLHLKNKNDAYALLRGTLHLIRDRVPKEEVSYFASQLPILIKGVYYDGWVPHKETETPRSEVDVIEMFKQKIGREVKINLPEALAYILRTIADNIDLGQFKKVFHMLPKSIRKLIPE